MSLARKRRPKYIPNRGERPDSIVNRWNPEKKRSSKFNYSSTYGTTINLSRGGGPRRRVSKRREMHKIQYVHLLGVGGLVLDGNLVVLVGWVHTIPNGELILPMSSCCLGAFVAICCWFCCSCSMLWLRILLSLAEQNIIFAKHGVGGEEKIWQYINVEDSRMELRVSLWNYLSGVSGPFGRKEERSRSRRVSSKTCVAPAPYLMMIIIKLAIPSPLYSSLNALDKGH